MDMFQTWLQTVQSLRVGIEQSCLSILQMVTLISGQSASIFFSILKHFADGDPTPYYAASWPAARFLSGKSPYTRMEREEMCSSESNHSLFFNYERNAFSPFFSEMHEKCHFWTLCTRNSVASMLGSCHAFQCPFSTCQITSTLSLAHRSMWTYTYGRDKRGTNKCHPTWSK